MAMLGYSRPQSFQLLPFELVCALPNGKSDGVVNPYAEPAWSGTTEPL